MKYDVEITSIDHSGRGISRINDKIVFVPKTLIGDFCTIKITKNKKKYFEAELIQILKPSKRREKPLCRFFDQCGGCDLMHTSYANQLRYKEETIKNIMARYTTISNKKIKKIIPFEDLYFYRNKVNFKVRKKIGFYQKKSYDIVAVDRCLIADININKLLKIIQNTIDLSFVKEITIRSSFTKNDIMVIFYTSKKLNIDPIKKEVNSIIFYDGKNYKTEYGNDYIIDTIGSYQFIISPSSFFQINTRQAEVLYDQVIDYAQFKKDDIVLDLYSGTGTIGIYVSSKVKKVIGVEMNKDAVKDANKNKEINHIANIEFYCEDVSKYIQHLKEKIDVVIVDPPRSGLTEEGICYIKKTKAERLIYVSCDPITLARDLEKLKDEYETEEITPIDMFSHTYHVECVCLLNRR